MILDFHKSSFILICPLDSTYFTAKIATTCAHQVI